MCVYQYIDLIVIRTVDTINVYRSHILFLIINNNITI